MSESEPENKICGRCHIPKLIDEFGVCRARKDGRNLYCKSCARKMVYANRGVSLLVKRAQEMAKDHSNTHCSPIRETNYPPEIRVLRAIKQGAKTQPEIARQARLFPDELGNALATLILVERKVVSRVKEDEREYFIREVA